MKVGDFWPEPMKLENYTVQKSLLVGDNMKTWSIWSRILVAITVQNVELIPEIDFSYHSCKTLGLQGCFMF